MWILLVFIAMIIFVNFIIAEVSEAYVLFSDKLISSSNKERACLIDESEGIIPSCCRVKNHDPRFIIERYKED